MLTLNVKKVLPIVLLIALTLGACQAAAPEGISAGPDEAQTIAVEGVGKVSLSPDLARISIGVETENPDPEQAVQANNQRVEDVMAVLEDLGIPQEDIQTANFSIRERRREEPRMEPADEKGETGETTYVVNNTVRVTLRDINQLGELLNEVVESGANTIHSIQFDASQKDEANRQALQRAIEDARSRAEVIAESAGVELGELYSVETFGGGPVVSYAEERVEEEAAAVPIAEGQLTIEVTARVRYKIK